MFDLLESSRRIVGVYRGEEVDRVPIISPISWAPHQDIDAQRPEDWRGEPGFVKVARLVQAHCDPHPPHNAVRYPRVFSPISYQRFCEAPAEYVEELPPEPAGNRRTRHTTLLHTPKGDLRYVYEQEAGIYTRWDMHRPIQGPEDVERMLSVPYRFEPPSPEEFEPFRRHRAQMGEYCLGGSGVNSMVAMLCGMMSFQLLLEWVISEPGLIRALADAWLARTGEKVDFLLDQGVGPFWHFNGVERASPPMMGPRQWEQWVVPYDGEIMRRIKQRDPDSRIHVHCHGRVGTLLDSFIEMGVDSTDPVEPPPQGDVEFGDAKRHVAGRLTLYGNIEFLDMETCTADQVEAKVRHAIEDGGKAHTVLDPSAGPHERPTDRFIQNAVRYIEAGVKYGRY
jgi:uroporphyrinogen-III decarboxylase